MISRLWIKVTCHQAPWRVRLGYLFLAGLVLLDARSSAHAAAHDYECYGRTATIVGTNGSDKIYGTAGPDVIVGLGGNDKIYGRGGNDVICGGDGNDKLYGQDGDDSLYGEAGNDKLNGDKGDDTLDGGDGNDKLYGSKGNDTLTDVPEIG